MRGPGKFLSIIALALGAAGALPAQTTAPKEQPPAPGPLRRYSVPPVQIITLENGLRIALVEKHSLPVVAARIQVDAGAVHEPANRNGVAVLTASLLAEGTAEMNGAQLAEAMADIGAQFGTTGGFGFAAASVTSLADVFPRAFDMAAKAVMSPAFTEADFNRVRTNSIAAYERSLASGSGVASRIFPMTVYDSATPYSRLAGGTKTSLTALTRDDVVSWHRAMYSPANTTVLIVGDITPAAARAAVSRAFAGWNVPAPALSRMSNRTRDVAGTRIILVDRPGSVQTSLVVGQGTVGWDSPDYMALLATSQILGGAFGSRLNTLLREKHGWTYGAFNSFNPLHGVGTFAMNSEVRTNVTDSAIAATVKEYGRIASEPVPATEVRDQLNNVVASFPSSVQTVQGLMSRLVNVVTYRLPLDFYSTYRERLAAVTPADVSRVTASRLTPQKLTIVAVGDLKSIEAPVRALNLGTVEVWDAEGRKIR